MLDSNVKPTPMLPIANHKSIKSSNNDRTFPYRKAIGALLHAASHTRLDISFAVGYLARFQSDPQNFHWALVRRIFRYLKGTLELGILFDGNSNTVFDVYVDADHAGDPTCKSTSGFIIRMFGNPIAWSSKRQLSISESTAEAEYIAICDSAKELLFLTRLTEETLFKICPFEYPITIYEDNIAALRKCKNSANKGRLKSIELRYLKVIEYVKCGLLSVKKIKSKSQLADILTKPVPADDFKIYMSQLMTRI